jgi:hypothetical protein
MAGTCVGADEGVPQIGPTEVMSALQPWLIPNLLGISSYNQGISELNQRLARPGAASPAFFRSNFLAPG